MDVPPPPPIIDEMANILRGIRRGLLDREVSGETPVPSNELHLVHKSHLEIRWNSLETSPFIDDAFRTVAHQLEMHCALNFLSQLEADVKKVACDFISVATKIKPGEPIKYVQSTNIVSIFETISKCSLLIGARANILLMKTNYKEMWTSVIGAVGIDCNITVRYDTNFSVLPLLTYSHGPVAGIYPVISDCRKLGAIIRNANAHQQVIRDKGGLAAFSMLYPQLSCYSDLLHESRVLWLNVETRNNFSALSVAIARKGAGTEFLVERFNQIVQALDGNFAYEVGQTAD